MPPSFPPDLLGYYWNKVLEEIGRLPWEQALYNLQPMLDIVMILAVVYFCLWIACTVFENRRNQRLANKYREKPMTYKAVLLGVEEILRENNKNLKTKRGRKS